MAQEFSLSETFGHLCLPQRSFKEVTKLPQSSLEIAESLEQLRWLQNGYKIKVGTTDVETVGIDTPEDLQRAEDF